MSVEGKLNKDKQLEGEVKTGIFEKDPLFRASAAFDITKEDLMNWNNKSDFSGNYEDLNNKPEIPIVPPIPTKTSELTNDSEYQTLEEVNTLISTAIGTTLEGGY